jgi:hypothetical protein
VITRIPGASHRIESVSNAARRVRTKIQQQRLLAALIFNA